MVAPVATVAEELQSAGRRLGSGCFLDKPRTADPKPQKGKSKATKNDEGEECQNDAEQLAALLSNTENGSKQTTAGASKQKEEVS